MRILIRFCLAAMVLAMFAVRPAAAYDGAHDHDRALPSFAPSCHAAAPVDRTATTMITRGEWTCTNENWRSNAPSVWLRFDAQSWSEELAPRQFFSRIARFTSITFFAVNSDGTMRTRRYGQNDGRPFAQGPAFELPLPDITPQTKMLLVRIEAPHSVPLLTEARITHDKTMAQWQPVNLVLLAFVMGMLTLPLLFDVNFYVVLRERFVLLHAGLVASMMVYVMFAGGLVSAMVTLPLALIAVLAPLSYAMAGGLAALFVANFLERGAQSRLMRRATIAIGYFTMVVPGFLALQFDATQPFDDRGYFITFIPLIIVVSAAVIEAVLRGSRSARFIAMAWAPIIIASTERLLRGLGWYVGPASFDQMLYVAIGVEVVVISLAIADRFLALRRERDAALTEARLLEQISTRDSLTGLMNRRAIEARFDELMQQGFNTFALIDLDRFKAINDLHGHQVGDAALIACADAIRANADRDSIAVRLGGEEFVVLLRGEHTLERAEALRRAIPMRIANQVPGLDLPVTASMGVVVMSDSSQHAMAFAEFYARADALMYEAKASGRNRLAYERQTVFSAAPRGQKRANAARSTAR